MKESFQKQQRTEESDIESKRPAFFQRDSKIEDKEVDKDSIGLEPWQKEEYDAYKSMKERTEVDFLSKDVKDPEKVREFYKIPKDKGMVDDMNDRAFDFLY